MIEEKKDFKKMINSCWVEIGVVKDQLRGVTVNLYYTATVIKEGKTHKFINEKLFDTLFEANDIIYG